jgi:Zinc finger, C3HC4 type (RING finger)
METTRPDIVIDLPEDLKCIICMDLFLNPVVLSCGHSFCKVCVQDLIRDKPSCPVCRTPTLQGVENLLPNFTLKNLIERDYSEYLKHRINNEDIIGLERRKVVEDRAIKRNIASFPCKMLKSPLFPGSIARVELDYYIPRELITILAPNKLCILGIGRENKDKVTINTVVSIEQVIESSGNPTKIVIKGIERCRIVNIKSINAIENEELAKKLFDDEKATFYVDIMDVLEYKDDIEPLIDQHKFLREVLFIKTKISHYLGRLRQHQQANYLTLRNHHSIDHFQDTQIQLTPDYLSQFSMTTASILTLPSAIKHDLYTTTSTCHRHTTLVESLTHTSADIDPSSALNIDVVDDRQSIEIANIVLVVIMIVAVVGGLVYRIIWY